ncbi:MAG TPA: protease complex subunit PrcB family protein [Planctomycetota bacterium]|nr:protease complex subunit PrcB family protein [Planctomycetota bacterium]
MILLLATVALLPVNLQEPGESVPFTILDKGASSGFQSPREMFVSSQKDWAETWAMRLGAAPTKKALPVVDFERDVAIVAAVGMQNTGGYAIEITRIVRTKDAIEIFVKRSSPPEGTKPGGGATAPFVLARMKKPDRPVTFRDEEKK